jgi:nucleoside-diphosphate-sugar epimerase
LNYLVTGCAGFLGFSLTEKLLKDSHLVFGMDNMNSGNPEKIEILTRNPNFTFEMADVVDSKFFTSLKFKPNVVINFATVASPNLYQKIPVQTLLTCVVGTKNLLEFSTGVNAKFIQVSSSEVYGDPLIAPISEDYVGNVNIHGPRACYDIGKQAAESLCADFYRIHNTQIQILRVFNTYGENQSLHDSRVVPTLIRQALMGEPMTVSGDGEQIRSFMHVEDFLEALGKILTIDKYLGPVNIGNPEPITMHNLAKRIRFISESTSEIAYTTKPVDDPVTRIPSIDKIKTALGWEPKIELDHGLQKLISHHKKLLKLIH